jgi:protein arginine kinase activator
MRCEICNQNEAVASINHQEGGEETKLSICESCAAKRGLNLKMVVPLLTDLILGMGAKKDAARDAGEKQCPACHLKRSEFRKTSLLGCAACYDAFVDEVGAFLESMQKGPSHTGKVLASHRVNSEVEALQKSLQQAVREQDFERAARLRDQMGALKARPRKASAVEG